MTEVQEPQANPYNAKKSWHEEPEASQGSADSLFFQAESSDEATPTEEGLAPQKQKGTNYKKRYDDLKRHYDERIAEFKQKEQELLAQAQAAQSAQKSTAGGNGERKLSGREKVKGRSSRYTVD